MGAAAAGTDFSSKYFYRDGSATPMRGKSLTCRAALLFPIRSATSELRSQTASLREGVGRQVIDLPRIGVAEPRKPAVRSAWQSHRNPSHGPNRCRYSIDVMKALTISAL